MITIQCIYTSYETSPCRFDVVYCQTRCLGIEVIPLPIHTLCLKHLTTHKASGDHHDIIHTVWHSNKSTPLCRRNEYMPGSRKLNFTVYLDLIGLSVVFFYLLLTIIYLRDAIDLCSIITKGTPMFFFITGSTKRWHQQWWLTAKIRFCLFALTLLCLEQWPCLF